MTGKLRDLVERLRSALEAAGARRTRRGDGGAEPVVARDYHRYHGPHDPTPAPVPPVRVQPSRALPSPPPAPEREERRTRLGLGEELSDPARLRRLVSLREILGPPLALRRRRRPRDG